MIHLSKLASRLNYSLIQCLPYILPNTHKGIMGNPQFPSPSRHIIFNPKIRLLSTPRSRASLTNSSRPLGRLLKFNFSTFNVEDHFSKSYDISSTEAQNLFMKAQREYYAYDNPQRALQLLQKAVDLEPHNIEFLFQISRFFNRQGELKRELNILHRILKLADTQERVVIIKRLLWSAYMISGNEKQSQQIESELDTFENKAFFGLQRPSVLRRAQDPSFFKYSLAQSKGDHFLRNNKPQIAMKYYRKVVDHLDEVKPQNRFSLIMCADNLLRLVEPRGDSEAVILCVQKLLQAYKYKGTSPDHVLYIMLEGMLAHHSGHYRQAIQKYLKCQELGLQTTPDTLNRLVDCYSLCNDDKNALAQGKIFLEKYGDDHQYSYHFYRRVIDAYVALKRFDEALMYVGRIQNKMDKIEFYLLKYDVCKEANELDQAIECLDIILSNSKDPQQQRMALYQRNRCNQELGRLELALSDLNKLIKSHADDKGEDEAFYELIKGRGQMHFYLQNYKEALRDFSKALKFGADQEAIYCGAKCLEELGEKEKAKGIYLKLKKEIDEGTSTLSEEIQAELLEILSK